MPPGEKILGLFAYVGCPRTATSKATQMPGNENEVHEKEKRRDAVNAVRLMCLDHESAAAASKTFNLYPCDLAAARRLLQEWPHFQSIDTTETQRVEYLLGKGWRKRRRS